VVGLASDPRQTPIERFLIREAPDAFMLSRLVDYLRLVTRVRPQVSVPLSGDRHSVSYSPRGLRSERTLTFRSVGIFTLCVALHTCGLNCEDLVSVLHRLSLLSGLVKPKSGQPEVVGSGLEADTKRPPERLILHVSSRRPYATLVGNCWIPEFPCRSGTAPVSNRRRGQGTGPT